MSINNTNHRRRQGEHRERSPPEIEKIVVEKWCYFRRLYFQQQLFQNSVKNSIFLLNFYQKFLKVSQQFVFFVQTAKNEHLGLLILLKNMLKQWIFCNFIQKFFGKFRKFLKISQRFVFFVQTAKNQCIGLLIFYEKYAKIMRFQQFS